MLSVLLLCFYQSCFCFFTVFAQTALYAVLHWLSVICSTRVASPHCVLSHWSHDFTVWVTCSPKTPRLRQRKSWCFPTVLSSGSLLCCTVTHASSHMLFEHAKKHFRTDSQVRVSAGTSLWIPPSYEGLWLMISIQTVDTIPRICTLQFVIRTIHYSVIWLLKVKTVWV